MRSDEDALAEASRMDDAGTPQRVPAPVVYELFIGVGYGDHPTEDVGQVEAVIDSKPFVPMSEAIARKAGRLKGRLKAAGDDVGVGDTVVGATGLALDEPVLTRNVDDFELIPGRDVATY